MKMQLVLLMILSTILFVSCEKESRADDTPANLLDYEINYGTSFGMCVGPCRKELNLVNDNFNFTVFYTEGRGAIGGIPKVFKEKLDLNLQKSISQSIDYEAFKKLNNVIGCPDCADGGAEFVELIRYNIKHKVTFEYENAPKEIEKLVTILREKRVYFEEKYLK
jgi:hypothetical protein